MPRVAITLKMRLILPRLSERTVDLSARIMADLSAFGLVRRNCGGGSRYRGPARPVKSKNYLTGVAPSDGTGACPVKFMIMMSAAYFTGVKCLELLKIDK